MSFQNYATYRILDLWADAPPELGYAFVQYRLRLDAAPATVKEIKRRVWLGLVELRLLDPTKELTPKDWKRAKRSYLEKYRHRNLRK